ncbi:MAG: NUDIX domain-containing protein, partial [Gammaproteobacteria bacterium]
MSDSIVHAAVPRPAVAGVLRSADGRILLALRNPQLKFMGGHYAFPGGSVDADDAGQEPQADRSAAVDAMALTRELFEETGLLLARGALPSMDERREARQALLDEKLQFQDFLNRYDLRIDVGRFRPAGLFVTPETSPRRFHARYYLVDNLVPGDEELIPGERIALDWMDPADARRRWRQKEIDIAPPVAFVLKQLADLPLDAALERLGELEPLTGDHAHCHEARFGIRVMPLRSPTLPPARHTNCFMIGETHVYVIDPAATDGDERRRLIDQLEHMKKHDAAQLAAV